MTYDSGDRTASAFYKWATLRVPNHVTKLSKAGNIESWVDKASSTFFVLDATILKQYL